MEIIVKGGQLLLSLAILVVLHEAGHFFAARLFKVKVEKFYLFFNPWFSLFKFKKGDTEYGIGWLPLGGYVKIAGMIDESMDKDQMKKPPEPWEFRSKPAWQRLIIMLGGIFVNIILAIVIYWGVLLTWGEDYLPTENAKYGIVCDSSAQKIGLQNGDKIISIDEEKIERFSKIQLAIIAGETIRVKRGNEEKNIAIPISFIKELLNNRNPKGFISYRFPFDIGGVAEEGPAEKAGFKENDKIIAVNDQSTRFFDQFVAEVSKRKNEKIEVHVLRGVDTLKLPVTVSAEGAIGIQAKAPNEYLQFETKKYGFFEALPAGAAKAKGSLNNFLTQIKLIFTPELEGYKHVGGFITIGKIFPGQWDWNTFWTLTAFLSIMLAFINVLPIPALDGGHALFTIIEMITGRKPSMRFLEIAQMVGMILLLGLFLLSNGNDVIRLFR